MSLAAALMVTGCSAAWYTQDADREVYGIIESKQDAALGRTQPFTIAPRSETSELAVALNRLSGSASGRAPTTAEDPAGELPPPLPEPGPHAVRLSMADALRLAVLTSRDYQAQKETVYLAALALTFERYLFRPHPFATGTVSLTDDTEVRERTFDGASEIGISQQLADGMVIVGSIGLTALKFVNQELGDALDSTLDFSLTQPLWRGAGRKIVQENLTQAERNAVYAVRTFARFEKTFAVAIADEYLRVLQNRDRVLNEWRNYGSLRETRTRAEWLMEAGRRPAFEVDQARQDELAAYNAWIVARQTYEDALDAFKLELGVPVTAEVVLVPEELDRLSAAGLREPGLAGQEAVAKALATRLDLATSREGLEDAKRRIIVAEDGLSGDVDFVASIGYTSRAEKRLGTRLAFHEGEYSIGLDIDMPVDRLNERNALREAQIDQQQAARALALRRDTVVLEVRRALRQLEQAKQSYAIQANSLELAERRVESTQLLLQAGRATQRDVLESQRALVDARNNLTRALVDHAIAHLEFERDVGTLVVNEEGQIRGWNLVDDAE